MAPAAKSSTARDRLIRGAKLKAERLTIMLEGEPLEVEVRGMSAGVRGDLLTSCVKTTMDEDGEDKSVTDLGKMYPSLIINSLFDVETGEPLFGPADLELVRSLDASTFDPIIKVASRLSALGIDAQKAIEGNSAATTASASASASPAN